MSTEYITKVVLSVAIFAHIGWIGVLLFVTK